MILPVLTFACDNCGLCCTKPLVKANAVDAMREPRIRQERRRIKHGDKITDEWMMNADGDAEPGPCAFHTGDKCSIYATRPGVCVAFQAGSPLCLKLREEAGLGPLVIQRQEFDEAYVAFGVDATHNPV